MKHVHKREPHSLNDTEHVFQNLIFISAPLRINTIAAVTNKFSNVSGNKIFQPNFIYQFILLRASLPRPRNVYLMDFGWKILLPLTLLKLLVTKVIFF